MPVVMEYEPYFADPIRDGNLKTEMYRIKHFADEVSNEQINVSYSTENIFYLVRLDIARGKINHRNVSFKYMGHIISLNKYGQYEYDGTNWESFLNTVGQINELLVREIMRIGAE